MKTAKLTKNTTDFSKLSKTEHAKTILVFPLVKEEEQALSLELQNKHGLNSKHVREPSKDKLSPNCLLSLQQNFLSDGAMGMYYYVEKCHVIT